MGMVSMKRDDTDAGHGADCHGGCGLCLCLDEAQVAALGLHRHPPAAGAKVSIRAVAAVRRVAQDVDGDEDEPGGGVTLELHITDLEVTQGGTEAARVLYGNRAG